MHKQPPPLQPHEEPSPPLFYLAEGPIVLQAAAPYADLLPTARLLLAAEVALAQAGFATGEMSLVIAGDEMLRQLNHDYRGIDAPTDVLSFSSQEESSEVEGTFVQTPEAEAYLGDVIISYPTAARQAESAGHPIADELCLLAVHGTLHLLGYDHATAAEEAAMWDVQAAALAVLGITVEVPRQA